MSLKCYPAVVCAAASIVGSGIWLSFATCWAQSQGGGCEFGVNGLDVASMFLCVFPGAMVVGVTEGKMV